MKRRQGILKSISKNRQLTDFEKKVYRAVLNIPRGRIRSYKWVAAKSGFAGASRAVGNALNKNPYVGLVPCHRVVKSDGSLGEFSRGRAEKARMLKAEGVDPTSLQLI